MANTGAPVPLHAEAVSKRFDRTVALDSVSFEVRAGAIFGLLGPNGAGRTTLIRTILDFMRTDAARIELFGAFQREDRNRIGYLPEDGAQAFRPARRHGQAALKGCATVG
jgi:ABC-2 type transport system ATP-binding protein